MPKVGLEPMLRQCTGSQRSPSTGFSGVWMSLVPFCEVNLEKFKTRCSLSRLHAACLESTKGALIEIVFGLPDSPRRWWKELRDTLQGDSWTSLKLDYAFFCLRKFSGHLIGRTIVLVVLLATNNSPQAESHISRFFSKYEIKDVKRANDDGGVLYCGR